MKYRTLFMTVMMVLSLGASAQAVDNFLEGWSFWSDTHKERQTVTLPHDAMQTETRSAEYANTRAMGYYPGNKYHYEKIITATPAMLKQHVTLRFEGVWQNSKVYVNNREVGGNIYGYLGFTVCLDGKLKKGKNVIRVDADNSQVPNSRWYTGAGIYRPVHLCIQEPSYIDKVKILTTSILPAEVCVTTTHQGGEVEVAILDGDKQVASASGDKAAIAIPDAKLWSADSPYLYKAVVTLKENGTIVEQQIHEFGVRQISWNTNGFFVNGQQVLLRGGCLHHDNGILGACEFDEAAEHRVRIMKEYGFNAIRSAHNPCSEAVLRACDKLGIYVMDELWDMWYEHKNDFDYSLYFRDNYQCDVEAIVEKDYNHPSVVMYSIANEPMEPAQPEGQEILKKIVAQLHTLDNSRAVTAGINMPIAYMGSIGINFLAGSGSEEPQKMSSEEFNKAVETNGKRLMEAVLHPAVDSVTTTIFDHLDISGYNYGGLRYEADGKDHPQRIVVGSETYDYALAYNWERVERLPYLIGDFMWTAWDYIGELGIGAWYYEDGLQSSNKPYPWILAGAGALDLLGNPTGEVFRAKAIWQKDNHPYIAVRPIHNETLIRSMWRGSNGIPSWSWQGCDGKSTVVEVFTSAKKVRLYLNGQLLDEQEVKDYVATFNNVVYQPGTLRAVTVGADGREYEASLNSAAKNLQITMTSDKMSFCPGELVYVDIDITDANGIIESKADTQISVKVEGGELLGFGSAQPKTAECFTAGKYTTYYGRSQAAVRVGKSGSFTLTVNGQGLPSVTKRF